MIIRDFIDPNIATLEPDTSVGEAFRALSSAKANAIAVYDGVNLHGIVSLWDLTARSIAENWDEESTTLSSIARRIPYCLEDDSPEDAAFIMWTNKLEQVLVLDSENRPIGLLSGHELLKMRTRDQQH